MKIDIHCHTSRYSACSVQTPEKMVETGIKRGLDGIIITEHFCLWAKKELEDLQQKYPDILILNGLEYSVKSYDILIYGIPFACSVPPSLTMEEVIDYFEPINCAFVLAHPFRFSSIMSIADETIKRFHAIEADSSNFNQKATDLSLSFAKDLNIPTTIASDSHSTDTTGLWYIETPEFRTMEEFVKIIKNGTWTHKIVRGER